MEGADLRSVDRDGLLGMMDLCLRSASLSLESEEFYDIRDAWGQLQGDGNKWSREWSLRVSQWCDNRKRSREWSLRRAQIDGSCLLPTSLAILG